MCAYVYLCISMCIYVYLCESMWIYVYLCIYWILEIVFLYLYKSMCIYVYLCIYMWIYVYLCIFMYILNTWDCIIYYFIFCFHLFYISVSTLHRASGTKTISPRRLIKYSDSNNLKLGLGFGQGEHDVSAPADETCCQTFWWKHGKILITVIDCPLVLNHHQYTTHSPNGSISDYRKL